MKLIIATRNKGKVLEIKSMLTEFSEVLSLSDIGFNEEAVEDGKTFLENAMKKATFYFDRLSDYLSNYAVLSDDSGLEVEALNGRPGVFSARYAGINATDDDNINKLLEEMKHIPFDKRNANFTCSMVMILPEKKIITSEGKCFGKIATTKKGTNGFGYDPVFLTEESNFTKTMAELSKEEKNKISHRYKALKGIRDEYRKLKG